MNDFKKWFFSERTLYHGTIVDNEPSIRSMGLLGDIGSFVSQMYNDPGIQWNPNDEVVYLADKEGLHKAMNAMVHHISKKLGKDFHDVTDEDIIAHGLILKTDADDEEIGHRPREDEKHYVDHPQAAEPGDYYHPHLHPEEYIKGNALVRLLQRYKQWPRNFGPPSTTRQKKVAGELARRAIAAHPDKTSKEVLDKIKSLSPKEQEAKLRLYRNSR